MDVQVVVVRGAEKPVSHRLENGVLEVWLEAAGTPPAVQKAEAAQAVVGHVAVAEKMMPAATPVSLTAGLIMDVKVVVVRGAERPVSYRLENGVLEVWIEAAGTPPAAKKAEALDGDYWLYLYEQTGRRHHPGGERMQRPARGRVQPL